MKRVKTRLIVIISTLIVTIIGIGIFSINSLKDSVNQTDLLKQKMEMQKTMKHIQFRLAGLSNDERGYLLTDKNDFAIEMKNKASEIQQNINSLKDLNTNTQNRQTINDLDQNFNKYWSISQEVITLKSTQPKEASDLHFGNERDIRKNLLDPSVNKIISSLDSEVNLLMKNHINTTDTRKLILFITTIISSIFGIVLGVILLISIMRPLKLLNNQMLDIAEGEADLTKTILVKNKDEFGELASSFNKFMSSLRELVIKIADSSEQITAASEEFSASSEQSKETSEQISYSMQQIASQSTDHAMMTKTSLESINDSMTGLMTISTNTSNVADFSYSMKMQADKGATSLKQVAQQMASIHNSVDIADKGINNLASHAIKIDNITTLINQISDQTNLLALNAAIEAARAGEYGKGFSVVADEVKKLAEQSNESAKQIKEIIQNIQTETKETVHMISLVKENVSEGIELSQSTSVQFKEIIGAIEQVSSQIQEIAATSEQISSGFHVISHSVEEIASGTNETSNSTEEIAAATEEQLASLEEISNAATSLAKLAEHVQGLVLRFKV
ncbi:HAMP domain-containing protein [Bacillus sp. RG28]|uniref:HAMP domain-containing protein n=1 Tax=Gottfriedia endophytica TaxID=2820819 RepID=A0A940SIN4_9BACI|nr:methyl-accepting chemotaxis protein [Gottfriedia endophytica]MBP0725165.1 HAMP domain-containing protein [Gottfriedia endophytica]